MSNATWTPVTDGNTAIWDKNKSRADLERSTILYDDASTTYDSVTMYYDGYNPATYTPEGEIGALWVEVAE